LSKTEKDLFDEVRNVYRHITDSEETIKEECVVHYIEREVGKYGIDNFMRYNFVGMKKMPNLLTIADII